MKQDKTTDIHSLSLIDGTPGLLAYSVALELEASERYAELAEQMASHNNDEVAGLFRELARIERMHADNVLRHAASLELPKIGTTDYRWETPEGPETTPLDAVHYRMTPHHALKLALHNEQRAADFFTRLAAEAADREVAVLATEMAEEEQEHVELIENWLARYPKPDTDWADDHDEPVGLD